MNKFMDTEKSVRPDHIYIELTNQCNLRCKHCYLAASPQGKHTLAAALVRRALNEFASIGGLSVAFSGGEPLLHPEWLSLVKHARAINLNTVVVTNGSLLDGDTISFFKQLDVTVALSIDGARETTHDSIRGSGSFSMALSVLDRLAANRAQDRVIICFTPTRRNVDELMPLARMLTQRGFYRLYISLLEERGRTQMHTEELLLTAEEQVRLLVQLVFLLSNPYFYLRIDTGHLKFFFNRLLNGWNGTGDQVEGTLRLSPIGKVYFTAYADDERFLLGDLHDGSLRQFWESEVTRSLLVEASKRLTCLPECQDCPYWIVCGGGSLVRAYMKHGSFLEPDELCEAKRLFLERWFRALL